MQAQGEERHAIGQRIRTWEQKDLAYNLFFEGDTLLGYWPLNPYEEVTADLPFDTLLANEDFREFKRHGYGRDFIIPSRL